MDPHNETDLPTIQLVNHTIEHVVPAMNRLGIRAVDVRPTHVAGIVPLRRNSNHLGTMYAGALFGLAEMLGGALVAASFDLAAFYPTVKEVQIWYRRPARSDVRAKAAISDEELARIHAEADRTGKAEFVLNATLTDADSVVVATTMGTYQVRAVDPALAPSRAL